MFRLQAEVRTAAERLRFLLDIAILPEEDLKLNSQTFNWPARMEPIFEVSQMKLVNRREKVEQELRARKERFVAKLDEYHSAVEVFQEKEIPRSLEIIQSTAAELKDLGSLLEECKAEAMDINNEEELLQWEMTPYPQIQAVLHAKEPYDKLWNTAVSYHSKHEQWMNGKSDVMVSTSGDNVCLVTGPFLEMDAEQVEEEVGGMWRNMHKLTRSLADHPKPKQSAEAYKMKLNDFKEHLPLLQTFCNHGLRDRHWQRVPERDSGVGSVHDKYISL